MEKEEFLFLLLGASYAGYRAKIEQKKKNLVPNFRYNVLLNSSVNNGTDLTVYPEDNNVVHNGLTDIEVMNLLCRNNKIPVWIDIYVIASDRQFTTFELICAERYSDKKTDYYYYQRGSGPFGIKVLLSKNYPLLIRYFILIYRRIFKR
ncbi:hypothetical protein [Emticicia sp. C21]|uniref:hypothetical protein n=1 Tax=Emticicia sp. C21 TaxID=2302915 RepID=UPI000E34E1F9|nr:hypothetical protein [Emticicia sp. C21]RFS17936.1 hypothetical protein D0T08_01440 [Emticicia sp. C21]